MARTASRRARPTLGELVVNGYRAAGELLRRREILAAALVSTALNVIFLETNAFIPLLRAQGSPAFVVAGGLVGRDVAAIVCGLVIARTGFYAARSSTVCLSLLMAAVSAAGIGAAAALALPVVVLVMCAVQGVVVGVGIAATNLYTIGATAESNRATGMAASGLPSRVGLVLVPMIGGVVLSLVGIIAVFYVVGGLFGVMALVVLLLRRPASAARSAAVVVN